MQKLKKILSKILSILGVVMVLVCSFVTPIFAVDISASTASTIMQPLFNYDYVEVVYDDGGKACFNIKDVFYRDYGISDDEIIYSLSDTYGSDRTITITFTYVDFDQVQYTYDGVTVNLPYWKLGFEMDITGISSVLIHSGESIYNRDFFGAIYSNHYDTADFFRADYTKSTSSLYAGQSSYFYYPTFTYGDSGQVVGRSLSSLDLSRTLNTVSSFNISPYVDINQLSSRFPSSVSRYYYYFSGTMNNIQVPSDAAYLRFNVHYIPSDNVVTFKEYHDQYFPSYRFDTNVSGDFTGWISTALSGFLSFEFAPGIKISTLLLFVLGIAGFNVFLKFFAGG